VGRLEGAELDKMLRVLDSFIVKLAQVTDTPISRFQITGQIARAETQKEYEGPLLAKVRQRQVIFGDAWEDCLYMARRLANVYGNAGLDEAALIETQWEPAAARDESAEVERLALKAEKLGVPRVQLWRELGYTDAQIAAMLNEPEVAQARISVEMQQIELAQARAAGMAPEATSAGRGGGEPVQQ
jgi:hypothetical protein